MLCKNELHIHYQFHTYPTISDIHGSDVCFSYSHKGLEHQNFRP